MHRGSQGFSSQRAPVHPSSQRQRPASHRPCGPQSKPHTAKKLKIRLVNAEIEGRDNFEIYVLSNQHRSNVYRKHILLFLNRMHHDRNTLGDKRGLFDQFHGNYYQSILLCNNICLERMFHDLSKLGRDNQLQKKHIKLKIISNFKKILVSSTFFTGDTFPSRSTMTFPIFTCTMT